MDPMSVKLTLILSGRVIQRYEFETAERLRIGRNEDCEVLIDNLGVSRYHAEICQQERFYVLRDLQSNNGTFVNGNKVESHNLNSGDVITIGKYSVEFHRVADESTNPGGGDAPETEQLDGAMTLQVDPASLARLAGASKATRIRGFLALKTGRGRNLQLEKPVFIIGADADADLRLEGWFCPRVVAMVFRDEAGFRLIDVTQKGTDVLVNGKQKRDVRLSDNDEIRIRNVVVQFNRGTPGAVDSA
jgi:pSer/pThr/pTyr-binding forkhead associated (FHA) protein